MTLSTSSLVATFVTIRFDQILSNLDAVQVIRDVLRSPESSQERKRKHFANVAISEVYFEAIPTVFLSMVLVISTLNRDDSDMKEFLYGRFGEDLDLYFISFTASMLSAAFGIAKY